MTLSRVRPVERVTVLQAPDAPVAAVVQVREGSGEWVTVGELSGGYTTVDVGGVPVGELRLVWDGGVDLRVHGDVPVFGG